MPRQLNKHKHHNACFFYIFAGKEVKVLERIGEISMDLDKLSRDIYDKAKLIYEMEQRNILLTEQVGHVFI